MLRWFTLLSSEVLVQLALSSFAARPRGRRHSPCRPVGDLRGMEVGTWKVLGPQVSPLPAQADVWRIRCLCGQEEILSEAVLRCGLVPRCPCGQARTAQTPDLSLVGSRVGLMTVVEIGSGPGELLRWRCRCDCGQEKLITQARILAKYVRSCGCLRQPILRLTGRRFGRLTVLHLDSDRQARTHWICQCDCGELISVRGTSLRARGTGSCGCARRAADSPLEE
jgi:hypothetical protein